MPDEKTKPVTLSKNTLIPVGVLVSAVVMAVTSQSWLDNKFHASQDHIDGKFKEQGAKFLKVEQRLFALEQAQNLRWNSLDMREWILDLRSRNPNIVIPDITGGNDGNN